MKNKLIMMAAALAAAFCASADTETVGDYTWTYRINGDTAHIEGTYSDMPGVPSIPAISPKPTGAVTIPSTLGGKPVASIGDGAFYECSGLASVTIPDSVTSIGYSAFEGCNDSIFDTTTIPGVKLVDGWAVGYTGSLSGNLNLTSVRGISGSAFYGCSSLTSVTIPNSVTSIGERAFSCCRSLANIVFEGNAPETRGDVFYLVNPDCTMYVRPGTTGWGVDIPGTWKNGLRIEYAEVLPSQVAVEINGATVEFAMALDGKTRTATVAAGTTAEDVKVFVGGVDVTAGFRVAVEGTTATVVLMEPFEVRGESAGAGRPPYQDNGDGNVTLNVELVPGLYYAADSASTIEALKCPGMAEPAKAGDKIVAPKQGGSQGYYKVWVSETPIKADE